MLNRLCPTQADNRFDGHRAALWLLGLFVATKVAMSLNIIFNTAEIAVGADGFRLDSYGADGARAVLVLFALTALGQLALALIALAVLVRCRALVPIIYMVLIAEHLVRRLIVASYAMLRAETGGVGWYVNYGLLTLLTLGLVLSLIPARRGESS